MSPTTQNKPKTSEADNARFTEIEALVTAPENKDRLQGAHSAATLRELAEELGVDTSQDSRDMGKFIVKLKMIGVDYVALNKAERQVQREEQQRRAGELAERANDLPIVRLWTGAVENETDDSGAFAVVDAEGAALEYGAFPPWEKIRKTGDLISAEQSAADKAVYIASLAAGAAGVKEVSLWLTTTCHELDTSKLNAAGARLGVAVDVTVDPDDMGAVHMAETPGWRNRKSVPTEELAALVESDDDEPSEIQGADSTDSTESEEADGA